MMMTHILELAVAFSAAFSYYYEPFVNKISARPQKLLKEDQGPVE